MKQLPNSKIRSMGRVRTAICLIALIVMSSFLASSAQPAWAVPRPDEACRDWYEEQAAEEQARENNEQQVDQDVDGDGCIGMIAAPGSDGPVGGGLKDGGTEEQEEEGENGGSGGDLAQGDSQAPAGGDTDNSSDCAEQFANDSPEEQMRERKEDRQFNVDNDKDGCIAEVSAEDSTGMDGTPAGTSEGEGVPEASADTSDDGGLTGMVLGFFKGIMGFIWDWTLGWALERMGSAFSTDLLSLPTLEDREDLLGLYKGAVDKLRPAILVGILLLGILMMVRSDNYDLAYAGFQGLPRLMGIAMALAFLPQFMGELSRITAGITAAFFPGGQDVDAAGKELFKAAVGNMAVTNFLSLALLVAAGWVGMLLFVAAILNKILYAVLFVSGAFALTASIVPSLYSLAGSWFRGVLASAAIPALWSIEMGIGTLVVTSPESIFGGMTNALGFISNSAVTSLGAIITMWIMYKTPFKCVEWAFNVQLPGRGGLVGLAKAGAALAIAVPAKTAVAHATKSLLNRSSGSGGAMPKTTSEGSSKEGAGSGHGQKGMTGSPAVSKGGNATRRIQQVRSHGQRDRVAENVSKAHFKYARERDRAHEGKERFMQGRPRGSRGGGMDSTRPGDRTGNRN